MRENGYYFVVFQKENYIAKYIGTCWTLAGNVNIYYDDDFDYIDDENKMGDNPKVAITLDDYCYGCADGCCTNYGTVVRVNGVEMPFHNQDVKTILEQVLQHLGYDVEITQTDNGE